VRGSGLFRHHGRTAQPDGIALAGATGQQAAVRSAEQFKSAASQGPRAIQGGVDATRSRCIGRTLMQPDGKRQRNGG
jgi:hypothetical protein